MSAWHGQGKAAGNAAKDMIFFIQDTEKLHSKNQEEK